MGIRLIVEVLDHAPQDLSLAERLVLVVIAEEANDATRRGWPPIDVIADRAGLGVRGAESAIRRLRERGYDLRVPLKVGKDGRKVYSWRGRSVTYQAPTFPRREGPGAERRDRQAASAAERPAGHGDLSERKARQSALKGPLAVYERPADGVGPSPHVPSDPLTPPPARARERPADAPVNNGGRKPHQNEPNARRAIATLVTERALPFTADTLLDLAYTINADPWDGYLTIKHHTEHPLDGARDPMRVLRHRMGQTP